MEKKKYKIISETAAGDYPPIEHSKIKVPEGISIPETTNFCVEVKKTPNKASDTYVLQLAILGESPDGKLDLVLETDLCVVEEMLQGVAVPINLIVQEGIEWALAYAIREAVESLEITEDSLIGSGELQFRLITKPDDFTIWVRKEILKNVLSFE